MLLYGCPCTFTGPSGLSFWAQNRGVYTPVHTCTPTCESEPLNETKWLLELGRHDSFPSPPSCNTGNPRWGSFSSSPGSLSARNHDRVGEQLVSGSAIGWGVAWGDPAHLPHQGPGGGHLSQGHMARSMATCALHRSRRRIQSAGEDCEDSPGRTPSQQVHLCHPIP